MRGGIRDRRNIINVFRPKGLSSFGNINYCMHYKDTTLTGFGYVLAQNTWGINPVSAVLTKHFRKKGFKLSAGNINSLGVSFQGALPLLGINLSKGSELLTDANVGSMSRHDLFLNAPAEVRIKVNGIEVNRLDLPSGSHVLQNFPLAQGINNILLEVTGPTGEKREIDVSMFYNPALMKRGEIATNASLGIPTYDINKGSEGFYSFIPKVAFSGYVRGGLLDSLTLTGYLQTVSNQVYSGMQGIFCRPYFKTVSELGFSFFESQMPQVKTRVAIMQPEAWKIPISWNMVFEGTQRGFRYFGGGTKDEQAAFLFSGSLGANVMKAISSNIVYQYGVYRDIGIKNGVQWSLSVRPMTWCSIRGMLKWEKSQNAESKLETAINFELTPKFNDFGTRTMYNSRQKALTTGITFGKSIPGKRSINGSVGFNAAPGKDQLEGDVNYEGAFVRVKASQRLSKARVNTIDSTVAITSANFGTALAFAGNKIALSKPIRDSFVIISPNKFLRNSPVVVNPTGDDYQAKASYYFPSVIPVKSYSNLDLSIVKVGDEYGGSFENSIYDIQTLSKSGSVVECGEKPTFIVEGAFYENDKPIEILTGMIISKFLVNGESLKYRFFTDSDGVFQVLDMQEGEYEIKFMDERYISIDSVVIKSDDDGITYINIGDFILKKIQAKKHSEVRK